MRLSRRSCLKAMGGLLAAGVAAGPLGQMARAAGSGGRLVVAVQDNPPQLDPLRLTTNVAFRVLENIYDRPLGQSAASSGVARKGLAVAHRQIDPTTFEIVLRDGVIFHDGGLMTAEDVAFTFGPERMNTGGMPGVAIGRQFFGGLARVATEGDRVVRFVTSAPDPLFEARLSGWASQVISKSAFLAMNGDWDRWAAAPVGTGPYKVAEMRTGSVIRLVAHDRYWGGRPQFDEIEFRIVPEVAARVNGLAAGDWRLATELGTDQIPLVEKRPGLEIAGGPIMNMRVLNFGTRAGGPLADVRIRRALGLAIDRQLIVDALFGGRLDVPHGYQWPAYGDMYIEEADRPRFDPEAARRLLAEAGYDGTPIPYRSQVNYYTAELQTAQVLVEQWKAVGLNVVLKVVENWNQVFAQPEDAIFNGSINMVLPDVMGSLWPLYGPSGFIQKQAIAWQNEIFDALGPKLATMTDRAERRAAHARVLEIFGHDDPPGTVLHANGIFYGKDQALDWQASQTPAMYFGPRTGDAVA
ncbi:ABC transporter substrate-binding protein (plasmid) [Tistrella mobilis]|uniref:ABC transporter substrate-binding protein n=1 Tax=Tistrella mobilis TaxID=171437 RepID=UPI003556EA6A